MCVRTEEEAFAFEALVLAVLAVELHFDPVLFFLFGGSLWNGVVSI